MVIIDGVECCEESLIEICALPDVNTNKIVEELSLQNPKSILVENTLNLSLLGLNALYISDYRDFLGFLSSVRYTWLFIDSIALYVDAIRELGDEKEVQRLYNKLWEVIYNWKVTVIAINHFKVRRDPVYCRVVPRLGFSWYRMCSYRVFVKRNSQDKLEYRISKNSMIEQ